MRNDLRAASGRDPAAVEAALEKGHEALGDFVDHVTVPGDSSAPGAIDLEKVKEERPRVESLLDDMDALGANTRALRTALGSVEGAEGFPTVGPNEQQKLWREVTNAIRGTDQPSTVEPPLNKPVLEAGTDRPNEAKQIPSTRSQEPADSRASDGTKSPSSDGQGDKANQTSAPNAEKTPNQPAPDTIAVAGAGGVGVPPTTPKTSSAEPEPEPTDREARMWARIEQIEKEKAQQREFASREIDPNAQLTTTEASDWARTLEEGVETAERLEREEAELEHEKSKRDAAQAAASKRALDKILEEPYDTSWLGPRGRFDPDDIAQIRAEHERDKANQPATEPDTTPTPATASEPTRNQPETTNPMPETTNPAANQTSATVDDGEKPTKATSDTNKPTNAGNNGTKASPTPAPNAEKTPSQPAPDTTSAAGAGGVTPPAAPKAGPAEPNPNEWIKKLFDGERLSPEERDHLAKDSKAILDIGSRFLRDMSALYEPKARPTESAGPEATAPSPEAFKKPETVLNDWVTEKANRLVPDDAGTPDEVNGRRLDWRGLMLKTVLDIAQAEGTQIDRDAAVPNALLFKPFREEQEVFKTAINSAFDAATKLYEKPNEVPESVAELNQKVERIGILPFHIAGGDPVPEGATSASVDAKRFVFVTGLAMPEGDSQPTPEEMRQMALQWSERSENQIAAAIEDNRTRTSELQQAGDSRAAAALQAQHRQLVALQSAAVRKTSRIAAGDDLTAVQQEFSDAIAKIPAELRNVEALRGQRPDRHDTEYQNESAHHLLTDLQREAARDEYAWAVTAAAAARLVEEQINDTYQNLNTSIGDMYVSLELADLFAHGSAAKYLSSEQVENFQRQFEEARTAFEMLSTSQKTALIMNYLEPRRKNTSNTLISEAKLSGEEREFLHKHPAAAVEALISEKIPRDKQLADIAGQQERAKARAEEIAREIYGDGNENADRRKAWVEAAMNSVSRHLEEHPELVESETPFEDGVRIGEIRANAAATLSDPERSAPEEAAALNSMGNVVSVRAELAGTTDQATGVVVSLGTASNDEMKFVGPTAQQRGELLGNVTVTAKLLAKELNEVKRRLAGDAVYFEVAKLEIRHGQLELLRETMEQSRELLEAGTLSLDEVRRFITAGIARSQDFMISAPVGEDHVPSRTAALKTAAKEAADWLRRPGVRNYWSNSVPMTSAASLPFIKSLAEELWNRGEYEAVYNLTTAAIIQPVSDTEHHLSERLLKAMPYSSRGALASLVDLQEEARVRLGRQLGAANLPKAKGSARFLTDLSMARAQLRAQPLAPGIELHRSPDGTVHVEARPIHPIALDDKVHQNIAGDTPPPPITTEVKHLDAVVNSTKSYQKEVYGERPLSKVDLGRVLQEHVAAAEALKAGAITPDQFKLRTWGIFDTITAEAIKAALDDPNHERGQQVLREIKAKLREQGVKFIERDTASERSDSESTSETESEQLPPQEQQRLLPQTSAALGDQPYARIIAEQNVGSNQPWGTVPLQVLEDPELADHAYSVTARAMGAEIVQTIDALGKKPLNPANKRRNQVRESISNISIFPLPGGERLRLAAIDLEKMKQLAGRPGFLQEMAIGQLAERLWQHDNANQPGRGASNPYADQQRAVLEDAVLRLEGQEQLAGAAANRFVMRVLRDVFGDGNGPNPARRSSGPDRGGAPGSQRPPTMDEFTERRRNRRARASGLETPGGPDQEGDDPTPRAVVRQQNQFPTDPYAAATITAAPVGNRPTPNRRRHPAGRPQATRRKTT